MSVWFFNTRSQCWSEFCTHFIDLYYFRFFLIDLWIRWSDFVVTKHADDMDPDKSLNIYSFVCFWIDSRLTTYYLFERCRSTEHLIHVDCTTLHLDRSWLKDLEPLNILHIPLEDVLVEGARLTEHKSSCWWDLPRSIRRVVRAAPWSNRPPPTGRSMSRERLRDPFCSVVEKYSVVEKIFCLWWTRTSP